MAEWEKLKKFKAAMEDLQAASKPTDRDDLDETFSVPLPLCSSGEVDLTIMKSLSSVADIMQVIVGVLVAAYYAGTIKEQEADEILLKVAFFLQHNPVSSFERPTRQEQKEQ